VTRVYHAKRSVVFQNLILINGNMMNPLNLPEIELEILKMVEDRDWDQFHSVKNLAMALTVEASELMEIFQWLTEEQSNQIGLDPKLKTRVSDEMADVFVYLLRMASKTGIDLDTAIREKMEKNKAKYPIELSRGNSKKYTEF